MFLFISTCSSHNISSSFVDSSSAYWTGAMYLLVSLLSRLNRELVDTSSGASATTSRVVFFFKSHLWTHCRGDDQISYAFWFSSTIQAGHYSPILSSFVPLLDYAGLRCIQTDISAFTHAIWSPCFPYWTDNRGGGLGKKEYKHNCFFSCQLAPLIFFPLRLWIPLTRAELGLRNFVILLVSLPTQPSDQLGTRSQLFNFANTIVSCVAQSPFLLLLKYILLRQQTSYRSVLHLFDLSSFLLFVSLTFILP